MSYQYNQTNSYRAYTDASQSVQVSSGKDYTNPVTDSASAGSSVHLGTIGDVITGTVLETGANPVVEMNGTAIRVRSDVLTSVNKGDRIFLRITGNTNSEITLKLVDQEELAVTTRNGAIQTEIRKNTEQFVEHLKQTTKDQGSEYQEMSEGARLVTETMTEEEKQKLRQMGIDVSSANLAVVKNLLSQMRGKAQDEELKKYIESVRREIMKQNPSVLEDAKLHIVDSTYDMQELSNDIQKMLPISEDQTMYLIQNHLSLTVDNLYKSQHIGSQRPTKNPPSDDALLQMQPQIERTIRTAGLTINQDTMDAAHFLLKKNLPLTVDSLNMYLAIQDLNTNGLETEGLIESAIDHAAIHGDTNFKTMDLYYPSAATIADQISEDLGLISDDSLFAFATTGLPYTLQNLSSFSMSYSFSATYEITSETTISSALTAHRQLEEIRLKMTWEASFTLASDDIRIRAKELTEVVEALRNQERDSLKQQLLADDIITSKDQLKLIEETNHKLQELPQLPAAAIASTVFSGTFNVRRLYEQGISTQNSIYRETSQTSISLSMKVSSYETLMTSPRADMGDSMSKAFRNVDDLLSDMNLPLTEDNRRATRILGYNQMEITEENLMTVKAADASVQTLLNNLQPSVVLQLVRDGINPLNMPIDELSSIAQDYIQEQELADEGHYAEFLRKLDRKGQITAEERKGYIGIYRLLDKVVKSKGKDIGTVILNGQGVTLQNLLTAHRSNRSAGMDTSVDDTFGGVETGDADTSISDSILSSLQASIQYNQTLAEKTFHQITPEIIDAMTQEAASGDTMEEFYDTIKEQITDSLDEQEPMPSEHTSLFGDSDVTNLLSNTSLELASLQMAEFEMADYTFMKELNIFSSLTNLTMAREIRQGSKRLYHDLSSESDAITQELEHLEDHLTSAEDMEKAYRELENEKADQVHAKDETGTITALDIQSLKMIHAGLRIMQKMSRQNRFQIPFSVNGTWNVMNLSIIENSGEGPGIQADIHTLSYGTITTSLSFRENHFEGSYSADSREGLDFLQSNRVAIADGLDAISGSHTSEPTTSELYSMAKELVLLFKHIMQ